MKKSFVDVDILAQDVPDIKPHQESRQQEGNPLCHQCNSANVKIGVGLKPMEQSEHCKDCGVFLRYSPVQNLKRLRRRRKFTESLELLENQGIRSEQAQLFLLSAIGGEA
jgi:hypothetical protein